MHVLKGAYAGIFLLGEFESSDITNPVRKDHSISLGIRHHESCEKRSFMSF